MTVEAKKKKNTQSIPIGYHGPNQAEFILYNNIVYVHNTYDMCVCVYRYAPYTHNVYIFRKTFNKQQNTGISTHPHATEKKITNIRYP